MTDHTPTPRTAAEVEVVHQGGLIAPGDGFVHHTGECEMVSADFARTLERELAEARTQINVLKGGMIDLTVTLDEARCALAKAETERERLERLVYVPGAWKCAKCACGLISNTLHVNTGGISANNTPQECPNGCGPMWRVTERDAGNDVCDRLEAVTIELRELKAEIAGGAHDSTNYPDGKYAAERLRLHDQLYEAYRERCNYCHGDYGLCISCPGPCVGRDTMRAALAMDKGKVGGDKTVEVHGHAEGDKLVIDEVIEREPDEALTVSRSDLLNPSDTDGPLYRSIRYLSALQVMRTAHSGVVDSVGGMTLTVADLQAVTDKLIALYRSTEDCPRVEARWRPVSEPPATEGTVLAWRTGCEYAIDPATGEGGDTVIRRWGGGYETYWYDPAKGFDSAYTHWMPGPNIAPEENKQ